MKLAILTGSSRGLGLEIAHQLIAINWTVLGLSRSSPGDLGPRYVHCTADLENQKQCIDAIDSKFNGIGQTQISEILIIHNASVFAPVGMLSNLSPESISSSFQTNFLTPLYLTQYLIQFAEAKKLTLKIIFISSPAASIGIPGASIYCATKAGVESLVRGIHAETPYYKTLVICASFMPGRIDTEMQAEMRAYSKEQFPTVELYQAFHKNGDLKDPKLVAKLFCENLIQKELQSGRSYSIGEF
jgi:benzil reductase ((S)-benzoin forming)